MKRPHGMGASDAPVPCGVSPWKTPWQLCLEKTGQLMPLPMSQAMRLGILLEPIVAQLYSEETGESLSKSPVVQHPTIDWAFCSPDRICSSGKLLEIKTTNAYADGWGKPGTDEIPECYLVQVSHQLACTGQNIADVAVLIGGQDFRIYTVHRNERLIDRIFEVEREFWRCVETNTPPPPDYSHASVQRTLQAMHGVEDLEIELDADSYMAALEYLNASEHIQHFERLKKAAKARLADVMKSAAVAKFGDGLTVHRKQIHRSGYVIKPSEYVRFDVRRNGK